MKTVHRGGFLPPLFFATGLRKFDYLCSMKYFISVGEASGDIHAAQLIGALRNADAEARFTFLGGDLMAAASDTEPLIHYRHMAYMGFSEVIRHLPEVLGNLKKAKEAITSERPDALILVDYPSFNLKLAGHAHSLGIPVYYYISPKVWAWKEHRVKAIKQYVRRMFSILPFETEYYRRHDYEVTYVGNPSVEEIEARAAALPSREDFLKKHSLTDRPILALVPGSRRGEIKCNLPVMLETASRFESYQAVVAGAPGIDPDIYKSYTNLPVVFDATFELMNAAEVALVTSGTATLECALLRTPQVVCYRSNGQRWAYELFKRILKISYVSLPNLIADAPVIPEMLLHKCNADDVTRELQAIVAGAEGREAQLAGYAKMRAALGTSNAAETTATAIVNDLKKLRIEN